MNSITNKNVILGVTGGVAAYKSAEIVRSLKKVGADVRVVMTESSKEFITPLTMQALSGNKVSVDFLDVETEAGMGHIELSRWADLVLIAPCTANTVARLAAGKAEDLLSSISLAFEGKLAIAPAMNQAMWRDARTQVNIKSLKNSGVIIYGPASGEQACGDVGLGRMLEVEKILEKMSLIFSGGVMLAKKILISAGPTQEPIDPIRFISNRSSGKMGYALAECAVEEGAEVTLISGPVNIKEPNKLNFISVSTAKSMFKAVLHHVVGKDIFISAAAVSDYSLKNPYKKKLKKNKKDPLISLDMEENKDILEAVANLTTRPYLVGFAAETDNLKKNARKKLECKKLDLIVANDVSRSDIGFDSDFNEAILIDSKEEVFVPKTNKNRLAREIINHISMKIKE